MSGGSIEELIAAYREPQLATLAGAPPQHGAWTYELKFDGYRILAFKCGAEVRLISRRGQDWTERFRVVARDIAALPGSFVLDGEVCALDANGAPSFQRLQNHAARGTRLAYFVFDLLAEGGEDLRPNPIEMRRRRLEQLVVSPNASSAIIFSKGVSSDAAQILAVAREAGLEGIVAKENGSRYTPGRSRSWLKLKLTLRQEFAIVGWLPLTKIRPLVGSLILGLRGSDDRFHFAGKVGTGFDDKTRKELFDLLSRDETQSRTAADVPRFGGLVHFVEPHHVAEVRFAEWTEGGHVRHPSFLGLRADKRPVDCVLERGDAVSGAAGVPSAPAMEKRRAPARSPVVAGVRLTHPDRVLEPSGVTKVALARYYEAVAERMLPHVQGRPLSLLRWSEDETEKGGVFLRHSRAWGPSELRRVAIQEKTKVGQYLVVESVAGLVALAQMDILEIHTWNSVVDKIERPNRIVFDLDPAPDVSWVQVVQSAREVRERLARVKLRSWVKTTGGKGLHVVVPLTPTGWDASFAFTRGFAQQLATDAPDRYIATMSKLKRQGRIFVDYLRNNRTSTSVAAFSIRARTGAPVSTPLDWDELRGAKPPTFSMAEVTRRMRSEDPWAEYWTARQRLPR